MEEKPNLGVPEELEVEELAVPWYRQRWALVLLVIFTTAILGAGGWFAWVRFAPAGPAAQAYTGYYQRLVKANSFKTSGHLRFAGKDFLSIYNTDLSYSGDYDKTNPAKPTSHLNFNGQLATKNYTGETFTRDGKLLFNLNGPDLPTIRYNQLTFLYHLNAGQWYVTGHDRSLFSVYCETRPNSSYPDPDLAKRMLNKLKVRHAKLINANDSAEGKPAAHYTATVDNSSLVDAYNSINKELPDGCQMNLPGYNLYALTLNYDLWVGDGFDKAKISFSALDSHGSWENTTSDYGEPVSITSPIKYIDLNQIWPK